MHRPSSHCPLPTAHCPLLPDEATGARLDAHFARWPDHRLKKYYDWRRHMSEAIKRAKSLGLDLESRRLEVLDLGGGLGYLAYVAQRTGHRAASLDIEHRLARGSCEILGVPMIGHTVQPGHDLPVSGTLDLITQFRLNLYHGLDRWGWPEYERFAHEVVLPRLNPGGRWHIDPNLAETGFILDADRWRRIMGNRAEVFRIGNGVTIEKQ